MFNTVKSFKNSWQLLILFLGSVTLTTGWTGCSSPGEFWLLLLRLEWLEILAWFCSNIEDVRQQPWFVHYWIIIIASLHKSSWFMLISLQVFNFNFLNQNLMIHRTQLTMWEMQCSLTGVPSTCIFPISLQIELLSAGSWGGGDIAISLLLLYNVDASSVTISQL